MEVEPLDYLHVGTAITICNTIWLCPDAKYLSSLMMN
jgi:hypothetical protein